MKIIDEREMQTNKKKTKTEKNERDRSYSERVRACNNWNSFCNDIESMKSNLSNIASPPFLIDKVIKKYLNFTFSSNQNQLKNI